MHYLPKVHGEDKTGTMILTIYGSDSDVLVMSTVEYELSRHMNEPKQVDLSDYVLSPMPGTLISFAVKVSVLCLFHMAMNRDIIFVPAHLVYVPVGIFPSISQEGDVVEMGQELCVVEAMKMQNVIRSHRAGATVGKLRGEVGASLRTDEILLEFEREAEEAAAA